METDGYTTGQPVRPQNRNFHNVFLILFQPFSMFKGKMFLKYQMTFPPFCVMLASQPSSPPTPPPAPLKTFIASGTCWLLPRPKLPLLSLEYEV